MKKTKNIFNAVWKALKWPAALLWNHKGKVFIVLVVIALVVGYWFKLKADRAVGLKDILTETVRKGDITMSINKEGFFQAKDSVEISAKTDGRIKEMRVKEGDTVKAGDLLAVVQPGLSEYDKFLPVEVRATMSGLVLRCLNARSASSAGTSYLLPKPGDYVSGATNYNPTCIMKIIKPGKYVVPIRVGEYDIVYMKEGMDVKATVTARPEISYDAFISFISPQPEMKEEDRWNPDANKIEFTTVAETKGDIKDVLIGLSATISAELNSVKDVLQIPRIAINEERNHGDGSMKYFVFKQVAPKKARRVEIKPGLGNDTVVELKNAEEADIKDGDILFLDVEGNKIEVLKDEPKKDEPKEESKKEEEK